jgi:hypothetical protein
VEVVINAVRFEALESDHTPVKRRCQVDVIADVPRDEAI